MKKLDENQMESINGGLSWRDHVQGSWDCLNCIDAIGDVCQSLMVGARASWLGAVCGIVYGFITNAQSIYEDCGGCYNYLQSLGE